MMKRTSKLKNFMIISFLLLTLLPILMISFITLKVLAGNLEKDIEKDNILLANSLANEIDYFLESPLKVLIHLGDMLIKTDLPDSRIEDDIQSLVRNYSFFESILVLDVKGEIIFNAPYNAELIGLDMKNESFYIQALKSKEPVWSKTMISIQTGQPTLALAVNSGDEVIVGFLTLVDFVDRTERKGLGKKTYIAVTDEAGTYIAHSDKNKVSQRATVRDFEYIKDRQLGYGKSHHFNENGEEMLLNTAYVQMTGWPVMVYRSKNEVFKPVYRLREIFLISILGSILAAGLIAYFSLNNILHALKKLSQQTKQIAAGDYNVLPQYNSFKEFNDLTLHFTQMSRSIKEREDGQKRFEEELEKKVIERTSALEAANNELEAFSYSVSHDLRAPLRAIDGFSRILLEEYQNELDSEGQRYLNIICKNTTQMGKLIDDLLSFSRMSRTCLDRCYIDIEKLVKSVFDEVRPDNKDRNIVLKLKQVPSVYGDLSMIHQVFVNLISNAIKFSVNSDPAIIEIGHMENRVEHIFYVKDNGVGFDMKFADKLFGVFQRLHRVDEFEGTGIGLAIVQRIINRHGGRVWAEGKVGEGAIFYFTMKS